jgi:hypothetical protein
MWAIADRQTANGPTVNEDRIGYGTKLPQSATGALEILVNPLTAQGNHWCSVSSSRNEDCFAADTVSEGNSYRPFHRTAQKRTLVGLWQGAHFTRRIGVAEKGGWEIL